MHAAENGAFQITLKQRLPISSFKNMFFGCSFFLSQSFSCLELFLLPFPLSYFLFFFFLVILSFDSYSFLNWKKLPKPAICQHAFNYQWPMKSHGACSASNQLVFVESIKSDRDDPWRKAYCCVAV